MLGRQGAIRERIYSQNGKKGPVNRTTTPPPHLHPPGLIIHHRETRVLCVHGSNFPPKMHSKINTNFNVGKVWNFMRKGSQNDTKTMSKIDDKSMNFRNLRFLVFFVKSITLKSFFHMIRGTRKLSKLNKRSMRIRCSKKRCTNQKTCSKREPE